MTEPELSLPKHSIFYKQYFDSLNEEIQIIYEIAEKARKQGFDPTTKVEIPPAHDVAARVEATLEGPVGVAKRIRELQDAKLSREQVAFAVAKEIAEGTLSDVKETVDLIVSRNPRYTPSQIMSMIDKKQEELGPDANNGFAAMVIAKEFGEKTARETAEKAADKAVRVALSILTESITAAPLEGISKVRIEGSGNDQYLALYLAGPIRAAGGTEAAMTVLVADYVRQVLNLPAFKSTEEETERALEEVELYSRLANLQYPVDPDSIRFVASRLPIMLTGDPTEEFEVSGSRDLDRIDSNRVRGGAVLVLNDGVVGKAAKLAKIVSGVKISGWEWLNELATKMSKTSTEEEDFAKTLEPKADYLADVIGGRPVFSHPSRIGGFRLRYGRSRNTGLAGVGVHPATMFVVEEFLATGTHIRTERPGKGAIVAPVDTIEGPIVLLKDGSVIRIEDTDEARSYEGKIERILYLGDILVALGEFLENNHPLVPSGYCEEWWSHDLDAAISKLTVAVLKKRLGSKLTLDEVNIMVDSPLSQIPSPEQAVHLSKKLKVPLHPYYLYRWSALSPEDALTLRTWILTKHSIKKDSMTLPLNSNKKKFLEKAGIPHTISPNKKRIHLTDNPDVVLAQLGKKEGTTKGTSTTTLELLNSVSSVKLMDKVGFSIGARMGRPEKAEERKMRPPVQVLFPVGRLKGTERQIEKVAKSMEYQPTIEDTTEELFSVKSIITKMNSMNEAVTWLGENTTFTDEKSLLVSKSDSEQTHLLIAGTIINSHQEMNPLETLLNTELEKASHTLSEKPIRLAHSHISADCLGEVIATSYDPKLGTIKYIGRIRENNEVTQSIASGDITTLSVRGYVSGIQCNICEKSKLPDFNGNPDCVHRVGRFTDDVEAIVIGIGIRFIELNVHTPEDIVEPVSETIQSGLVALASIHSGNNTLESEIPVELEMVFRICPNCSNETYESKCDKCGTHTIVSCSFENCGQPIDKKTGTCQYSHDRSKTHQYLVPLADLIDRVKTEVDEFEAHGVRGVLGLTSDYKIPEYLGKGILRAKHDVYCYRDGTARFDATDAPLTHFTPTEIGVPVSRLRELGYITDYEGEPLISEDQVVELKVQDIVVPDNCAEYLARVGRFVDDCLEKIYGLERFYKFGAQEDVVGQLVIGLAPHTSAGIVGRIIGFTNASVCFAHPYWHAAKRRNCDGDEDALILVLDALLNFSKDYLPAGRGGLMDAPLVLSVILNPTEVDDESHNIEVCKRYPAKFYEMVAEARHPKEVEDLVDIIASRLKTAAQYEGFGFTHDTKSFDIGPKNTRYKILGSMDEKLTAQLNLATLIEAVDSQDVAVRVLSTHFFRDIRGNLRAFSTQKIQCQKCRKVYRRIPLSGKCECGKELSLTVRQKNISKYLKIIKDIIEDYDLDQYQRERLKLITSDLDSLFVSEQTTLTDYFES